MAATAQVRRQGQGLSYICSLQVCFQVGNGRLGSVGAVLEPEGWNGSWGGRLGTRWDSAGKVGTETQAVFNLLALHCDWA